MSGCGKLASVDRKIQQLEAKLEVMKANSADGVNCTSIAKVELQLSQLYNQVGNRPNAEEMMSDAQKVLEDPVCPKSRETDSMLRYINFYRSNPGLANVKPLGPVYRYLSLIVLAIGYLGLYLASTLVPSFPTNDYFIGILAIFVLSMVINSMVRANYNKKIRAAVNQQGTTSSDEEISRLQSKIREDKDFPNPERILDAARSELALASIYYGRGDYASAGLHLREANHFLNDPLCESDQEKDNISRSVHELQDALNGKQSDNLPGFH